jgi:cytochrome b561
MSTVPAPAPAGYTRTAIGLHWLIALLIAAGFTLGLLLGDMKLSPLKAQLESYHKWIGVTVFLGLVLRAFWRLTHRPPPLPAMPAWQVVAAKFTHGLLYTLMAAVPITGWLFSSAHGYPVKYLGLWQLPDLVPKDQSLARALHAIHENFAWLMVYVAGLHAAAALKHHFYDRDDTLRRMFRR